MARKTVEINRENNLRQRSMFEPPIVFKPLSNPPNKHGGHTFSQCTTNVLRLISVLNLFLVESKTLVCDLRLPVLKHYTLDHNKVTCIFFVSLTEVVE